MEYVVPTPCSMILLLTQDQNKLWRYFANKTDVCAVATGNVFFPKDIKEIKVVVNRHELDKDGLVPLLG